MEWLPTMTTPPNETQSAPPGPTIDDAWPHRDDLILYARRLLASQAESAEDVVQEAFLRLHERTAAGAAIRDPRPWLFRVTRNLALDERRRARRGDAARDSLRVVAADPPGPHDVVQGREEMRHVLGGLGSLPPRERRTVLLEQAGLAPPAIARRMQTTTNAVHQSLFRARRRLRDARAAAWGLLPLPVIRLLLRAANAPSLEGLPPLAPGSGARILSGAGVAGIAAAALIGGGAVVDPPLLHPGHHRASETSRGGTTIEATASAPAAPARASTPARLWASAPVSVARVTAPAVTRFSPARSRPAAGDVAEAEPTGPATSSAPPAARSTRGGDGAQAGRHEAEDPPTPPSGGGGERSSTGQAELGTGDPQPSRSDAAAAPPTASSSPERADGAHAASTPQTPAAPQD